MIKKIILFILLMLPSLAFGASFYSPTATVGGGPPPNANDMSEAPYGGSLITSFGTFTWGGVHPFGVPNYYIMNNGVQVDAGDLVEIDGSGNVFLLFNGDWYGPWDPTTHFGASPNLSVTLPTIRYIPQTSNLNTSTSVGTIVTMIIGKNADTTTYGGTYSLSSEGDNVSLLDNRLFVDTGGLPAGPAMFVHHVQMLSAPTSSSVSVAPSGGNIVIGGSTWSWDIADTNHPGDYILKLNGTNKNEGQTMQVVGGTLYLETSANGWFVYNTTSALFEPSINPNGTYFKDANTTQLNVATTSPDLSISNRTITNNVGGRDAVSYSSPFQSSGLYYFECVFSFTSNHPGCGVGDASAGFSTANYLGDTTHSIGYYDNGEVFYNNAVLTTLDTFGFGQAIGVAVNKTAGKIWFRVNGGQWNNDVIANQNPIGNVGGISLGSIGNLTPGMDIFTLNDTGTLHINVNTFINPAPFGYSAFP